MPMFSSMCEGRVPRLAQRRTTERTYVTVATLSAAAARWLAQDVAAVASVRPRGGDDALTALDVNAVAWLIT